jgi:hypothetical protein
MTTDDLVIAATFDPPDAQLRYEWWREANERRLAEVAPDRVRVDIGRAVSGADFVRIWLPADVAAQCSVE